MKPCTASFAGLTYAIKAQKELSAVGIDTKVVKLDASLSRRGCTYGVQFDCGETRAVRRALSLIRLLPTGYHDGGGSLF